MNNTAIIKPQWSPLTIALMVLGFIVFWPLGLAVLAYILWGEYFGGSSEKVQAFVNNRREWAENRRNWRAQHAGPSGRSWSNAAHSASSGNAAFDDYREAELKRLEEERRRLDAEIDAFHEHMRNLRMARDREEFDRFMRDRNSQRQGYTDRGPQGERPADEHNG